MSVISYWNQVSLDVTKLDFTTPGPDVNPGPEQGGPTKTSRALAMIHLAMYDAYTATSAGTPYLSYASPYPAGKSIVFAQAAVCAAATETLLALFPRSSALVLDKNAEYLAKVP